MTAPVPSECRWQVDGLEIAGLRWGDPSDPPILALHGWLDNAASFNTLAPLLSGYQVLAIDLTGQGQSSRRSADASYQIWDDLPQIMAVVDQLGWQRFALMGHSRGAIISTLVSCACPDRISRVVLLDGLIPAPVPETQVPQQLGDFLQQRIELLDKSNTLLESVEQGVAMRVGKGLSRYAAEQLVPRSLKQVEGGFEWTNDPRLQGASAVKLSDAQLAAILGGIQCPVLLLYADQGLGRHAALLARAGQQINNLQMHSVKGKHHFHLDGDVQSAASQVKAFLEAEEP